MGLPGRDMKSRRESGAGEFARELGGRVHRYNIRQIFNTKLHVFVCALSQMRGLSKEENRVESTF